MKTKNTNYISARDIAEDERLNFEIEDELKKYKKQSSMLCSGLTRTSRSNKDSLATWILRSSRSMTRMYVLLSIITLIPTLAQAEQCTSTPDCKSLGYTQSSCPDGGGVKCPWNTSLLYCGKECAVCGVKSCQIGDVLYADKKCYACLPNALPEQVPVGIVFTSGKAIGLVDLSTRAEWNDAGALCNKHKPGGVSGWYLPSKDELRSVFFVKKEIQAGLESTVGGSQLTSDWYWSSSFDVTKDGKDYYYSYNPISNAQGSYGMYAYVRCVLAF